MNDVSAEESLNRSKETSLAEYVLQFVRGMITDLKDSANGLKRRYRLTLNRFLVLIFALKLLVMVVHMSSISSKKLDAVSRSKVAALDLWSTVPDVRVMKICIFMSRK